VGFGDIYPKSDDERLATIVILVGGVSIFSVFLGDFTNLLEKYNSLHADLEQSDSLDTFFNVLYKFNNNKELSDIKKNQIRHYFNYMWEHDRNQSVVEASDILLLE
jgi:hypothetical protein